MSWPPNIHAARILAREILPEVRTKFPQARLRIVGRDPTPAVRELQTLPGVEVTGTVPSIVPHLAEAHVLAVALESGGGTRLKILEAFAAGLPVVSTSVGCEGLRAGHDEHLIIAGRSGFADALVEVLGDKTRANTLARKARALAVESYDWTSIGQSACRALQGMLSPAEPVFA
jgi:glycosyltransferase involved in cell wall biosynthesis